MVAALIDRRALAMAAAVAALAWVNAVGAQQPAARKPEARLYYQEYQASHRQRLRRETCLKDEDLVRQYCIKQCGRGYVNTTGSNVPRNCRADKPLPAGVLPQPYAQQPAQRPTPPARSKPTPGA